MRLVAVLRVSRTGGREGPGFIAVDQQRDQITMYARAHGHTVTAWHEDLDQPGSTLDRPGLQAALAGIDRGEADGLIAAKLDRVTRSIVDLGKLLARARTGGWNLVAVDVGLDLGTPNGKLVAHVLGAVAEWELDRRRNDWEDARARAVARGIHVASKTPTGYQRREDGRLEPSEMAQAVRELFARRAGGDGWQTLAGWLTDSDAVSPYGGEVWTAPTVKTIIENRVYLGEARSGVYVHPDAHEALVTRAEWDAAQRPHVRPRSRTGDPLLLSGLVRCASCRHVARAGHMKDARGERLGLYGCRRVYASGKCPAGAFVLARILDPYVEEQFLAWLGTRDLAADATAANAEHDRIVAELVAAEAEVAAYLETTAVALVGRAVFERGLRGRADRVDELEQLAAAARGKVTGLDGLTAASILEAWTGLTRDERRKLLGLALDAVVVWPHKSGGPIADWVLLVWRGEGPADLPQRGRRVPLVEWPADRPGDARVSAAEDL